MRIDKNNGKGNQDYSDPFKAYFIVAGRECDRTPGRYVFDVFVRKDNMDEIYSRIQNARTYIPKNEKIQRVYQNIQQDYEKKDNQKMTWDIKDLLNLLWPN